MKPTSSNDRYRVLLLILILFTIVAVSGGITIALLYRAAFREAGAQLVEMARSQAHLVEAISAHARQTHREDATAEVAKVVLDTHVSYLRSNSSTEIRYARREGDRIVFLATRDRAGSADPVSLPFDTPLGEPMRRALLGESNTGVGLDLRGTPVLAAFEPLPSLGWGVVAKTDLAEIRQPFIVAGAIAGTISLLLAAMGAWWFTRLTQPMIDHLRNSERRYRFLFENMVEGFAYCEMILKDGRPDDFVYLAVNGSFSALTGLADVVGRRVSEVIPGFRESDHPLLELYARVARTGRSERFEYQVKAIGQWLLIAVYCPKPGHFVAVFDVITARKQAEEEIARLNAGLEQRVAERTAELEAANRELEAFSYSVSHDLRSPLRAIAGFSSALEEDSRERLDPAGIRYLAVIRRETARMGELIDDLLRLSRLSRTPLNYLPVDLSALAGELGAECQRSHPGRDVILDVEPGITVHADHGMIRIALENLLANAWKFTARRAQAHIAVRALADRKTGFVVCDDGVGFDMAYADRLFGAFQRLHNQSEFPGSGIGLATVARIIRRHGGSIRAEAAPDRGAAFSIFLPLQGPPP